MRPPSPPEARRFLDEVQNHPLHPLFTLAVTTGMRHGELLALRWRDVDGEARRVGVHHTIVRMNGRWWLGEPKTAKSRRSIEVTDPTIEMLRAHWARPAERLLANGHRMTEDDLVFCDAAGEPLWGRHLTTLSLQGPTPAGRTAPHPLPRPASHLRHPPARGGHQPGDRERGARAQGGRDHARPLQPRPADAPDHGDGPARRDPRPRRRRRAEGRTR
jgi:integrase